MDAGTVFEKIDFILKSDTEEALCLINVINEYYTLTNKNITKIIKCDFKKKEIIAFYEILKDDLGEGF